MNVNEHAPITGAPQVSVVITTLNRNACLCETLGYFFERENHPSFEVIVVDQSDQHDEPTTRFLEENRGRMKYVKVDYKSLCMARNDGIRKSAGEIIVFVDDDVVPFPGFLSGHVRGYSMGEEIGSVTGPCLSFGGELQSRAAVGEEVWRRIQEGKEMRSNVDFTFSAPYAPGCNMSFRRDVILKVGGFDENYLGGVWAFEDAETGHFVRQKGFKIQYLPEAALVHLGNEEGGCRNGADEVKKGAKLLVNSHYFSTQVGMTSRARFRMMCRTARVELRRISARQPRQVFTAMVVLLSWFVWSYFRTPWLRRFHPRKNWI